MKGITSYGAYVPCHRLDLAEVGAALGTGGKGTRSVAGYDEDTTSMGVEAARRAVAPGSAPSSLWFATTAPAYTDKTNATAVHSALGLGTSCLAADMGASIRSATGALAAAAESSGVAVVSDVRTGRPASADEREGGDGAAAFAFGDGDGVIAELIGRASDTEEFLDRWRVPGEIGSNVWEERFGREHYLTLIKNAVGQVLTAAGVAEPDHVVVSGSHARAIGMAVKGFKPEAVAATGLRREIGFLGAADAGVQLADVLDRAEPGQTILVISAADGCDAFLFKATDAIAGARAGASVRDQVARTRSVTYPDFLTWRSVLEREGPRRPDPTPPSAPPAARATRWKYAFTGARCDECGTMQLPPARVCIKCRAADKMTQESLADKQATIATFTIDRLAYSLAPPMIDIVVDFDGGGRYSCQMTDASIDEIEIGGRAEMTFRRLFTANGIHNYFWKARPVHG